MNSYRQSLYILVIRIAANVLMLAALFFSMYQTAVSGGRAELVFCLWFFPLVIPLWVVAGIMIRIVRKRFPAEYQSLVNLPGHGPCLVTWHVLTDRQLPMVRN